MCSYTRTYCGCTICEARSAVRPIVTNVQDERISDFTSFEKRFSDGRPSRRKSQGRFVAEIIFAIGYTVCTCAGAEGDDAPNQLGYDVR